MKSLHKLMPNVPGLRAISLAIALLLATNAQAGLQFGGGLGSTDERFVDQPSGDFKVDKVNFVTSVPLTGGGDTTGGFGDVASNVTEAIRYARSHPNTQVTCIVLSNRELEDRPGVAQSDFIVKTMIPELDASRMDVPQRARGVDFIFFSKSAMNPNDRETIEHFRKIAPRASLAVMLSSTRALKPFVSNAGDVALSFSEPRGSSSSYEKGSSNGSTLELSLNSGAGGVGYYLDGAIDESELLSKADLVEKLASAGIRVPSNISTAEMGFAYSKEKASVDLYVRTVSVIARRRSTKSHVIFVKDFGEPYVDLPRNMQVVYLKGVESSVMESLIGLSDIAPLVTGDGSLSTALSTARGRRGLLYEMNPWKVESQKMLSSEIAVGAALSSEEAASLKGALEIDPALASGASPEDLANIIEDSLLWEKVNKTVRSKLPSWSLVKNVDKVYRVAKEFAWDIVNGTRDVGPLVDLVVRSDTFEQAERTAVAVLSQDAEVPLRNSAATLLSREIDGNEPRKALIEFFAEYYDGPERESSESRDKALANTFRGALRQPRFQSFLTEILRTHGSSAAGTVATMLNYLDKKGNVADRAMIEAIRNGTTITPGGQCLSAAGKAF